MEKLFAEAGFILDKTRLGKFKRFVDLLLEYNRKFNLTAITNPDDIAVKHFIDSLSGLPYLPENGAIVDIGSGAGFPAIPLKIYRENLEFTLIDSLLKRVNFLNIVINQLRLNGISAKHTRAEEEAKTKGEYYGCAVARAVAPLAVLAEYALPLLKIGGIFIAYKGSGVDSELIAAEHNVENFGGEISEIKKFTLPNGDGRSLVLIKKISRSPKKYPRGRNKPRISPI